MFPSVLKLVLGNPPKSQGPNAAFSLQETIPGHGQRHQPHREDFVGLDARREFHHGLLRKKLAPESHPQGHPQSGMWVHGSRFAMMLGLEICQDPGKAIPGPCAWSAKIRACI